MEKFDSLYLEIGKFTMEFEKMNFSIKNTIKEIENLNDNEYSNLHNLSFDALYKRFKLALEKTSKQVDDINQLYGKLENLRKKRNNIIHGFCFMGYVTTTLYNSGKAELIGESEPTVTFYNLKNQENNSYETIELKNLKDDCTELITELLNFKSD